jgi:hypothetical protein
MEFASEMVIKAALRRLRIEEVPTKLLVDLRERAPHLRPWRDGWRHLRYIFMLSPTGCLLRPLPSGALIAVMILAAAMLDAISPGSFPAVGNYWVVLGAALLGSVTCRPFWRLLGDFTACVRDIGCRDPPPSACRA